MAASLQGLGYRIQAGRSDWRLGPGEARLQAALLEGYALAAAESDPAVADEIEAWRARRRTSLERGESHLQVGHLDLYAEPGPSSGGAGTDP